MDLSQLTSFLGLDITTVVASAAWTSLLMGFVNWAAKQEKPAEGADRPSWTTYVKRLLVMAIPGGIVWLCHHVSPDTVKALAESGLAAGGTSLGYVLRKAKTGG